MGKLWLILAISSLLIGCGGEKAELENAASPLRNLPIPMDEAYDESPTVEALDPILQDSILSLTEQEELVRMVESLLEELAYYKRLYILQRIKEPHDLSPK